MKAVRILTRSGTGTVPFLFVSDKASDQIPARRSQGTRRYRRQTLTERRAARRAKLIDAAVQAFGTKGFRATPIEELCAAAGISTRNFYEEFPSREALLIALHDELNQRALAAVTRAVAESDPRDLEARARAGTLAYFRVMTDDRRWARIALVESVGVSPAAERHRQRAIDRFAQLLLAEANRAADAGLIEKRDYRLTSVALVGAINGLINTWTAEPGWEAQIEQIASEGARLITLATRGP
jgi:AcrR family transcriptional regulator